MKKILNSFPISLSLSVAIVTSALAYSYYFKPVSTRSIALQKQTGAEEKEVVLPVSWGNLGKMLTETGAIDEEKFRSLYANRGEFDEDYEKLLSGASSENLKVTSKNSGFILNLLWALGLSNKNPILEKGPMSDSRYNGPGNFASTGGWTLAKGGALDHYSKHTFIVLTDEQQKLVEEVSKNIYRPCCNNPTHFPDCNHGMAMLGLLELLASQGIEEEEMYKMALEVNSLWFPDHYRNIGAYLEVEGIDPGTLRAKDILGMDYSSASAARKITAKLQPQQRSGGSCGV